VPETDEKLRAGRLTLTTDSSLQNLCKKQQRSAASAPLRGEPVWDLHVQSGGVEVVERVSYAADRNDSILVQADLV